MRLTCANCGNSYDSESASTVQVTETHRETVGENGYRVIEHATFAAVFCTIECAAAALSAKHARAVEEAQF